MPKKKPKPVPQALADLGKIFESRAKVYGPTYLIFGRVMMALFPDGITVRNEVEANRLSLVLHMADKLARYCQSAARGTHHPDSLDDVAVYSQLLRHFDAEQDD